MTHVEELEKQCIPISKLTRSTTTSVIKVLVIHRGSTKEYKNENGEGIRWQLIFVDEEGTKIQATLFNKGVHAWNESFELNQSYYIINGKLKDANPNFLSVHKEFELVFNNITDVVECKSQFNTQQFSNGFISFDEGERINYGTFFDVVCILIKVQPLNGEGRSKRREVLVTNEIYDRKVMTLWGDLAEIDGALLETLKLTKPVLAFCDVKCSIYQGDFVLSTTPISSLLINPPFEKANNLQLWHDDMKAQNIDISLMPSKLMQTACKVKVADILSGSLANVKKEESMYYRKMILSKGKEFSILVKIDRNFPKADSNMNLIAMEIHEVENELLLDESKAVTHIKNPRSQRTKNVKLKPLSKIRFKR